MEIEELKRSLDDDVDKNKIINDIIWKKLKSFFNTRTVQISDPFEIFQGKEMISRTPSLFSLSPRVLFLIPYLSSSMLVLLRFYPKSIQIVLRLMLFFCVYQVEQKVVIKYSKKVTE